MIKFRITVPNKIGEYAHKYVIFERSMSEVELTSIEDSGCSIEYILQNSQLNVLGQKCSMKNGVLDKASWYVNLGVLQIPYPYIASLTSDKGRWDSFKDEFPHWQAKVTLFRDRMRSIEKGEVGLFGFVSKTERNLYDGWHKCPNFEMWKFYEKHNNGLFEAWSSYNEEKRIENQNKVDASIAQCNQIFLDVCDKLKSEGWTEVTV